MLKVTDYGRSPKEIEKLDVEKLTTAQMSEKYSVESFLAPLVIVTRKSDGVRGSMEFSHNPRFYFNFVEYPNE